MTSVARGTVKPTDRYCPCCHRRYSHSTWLKAPHTQKCVCGGRSFNGFVLSPENIRYDVKKYCPNCRAVYPLQQWINLPRQDKCGDCDRVPFRDFVNEDPVQPAPLFVPRSPSPKLKYCPTPGCIVILRLNTWAKTDEEATCVVCERAKYRDFLDKKPAVVQGVPADPEAARERMLAGNPVSSWQARGFGGKQVGGTHYGPAETDVFAFCGANGIGMVAGTGIKYLARLGRKGEREQWIEDARKAIQCTERRCLDLGITLEELYGE